MLVIKKLVMAIILLPFLFIQCTPKIQYNKVVKDSLSSNCYEILKDYQFYWKNDSLGKNGFRHLLGDKHLKNCSVIGGDWDTLFKYLGKPNIIIMGKSDTFYRYRLNNFTEDLGAPGNLFLEISVQGGKVTTFAVVMVDG